jgi:PAB-dependent poly(A)-specific ribonuclease subunit 2
VHQRTAYLKLRLLADRGVTFVGHGLKTDFAVCNLFVPPAQVGDTLDLWALPRMRKLSLRLLAGCLLGSSIQVAASKGAPGEGKPPLECALRQS